jgi:hypothetical protein
MKKEFSICKNCDKAFDAKYNYCPYCGQKYNEKLTVRVLFYNTISSYFTFDARFFKSFIPLMTKPGFVAERFVAGKRLVYLHPAQLYLFVSIVFFFLFSIFSGKQQQGFDIALKKGMELEKSIDSTRSVVNIDTLDLEKPLDSLAIQKSFRGKKREQLQDLDSLLKKKVKQPKQVNVTMDFDYYKVDSLISVGANSEKIYKAMGMEYDAAPVKRKFYAQMLKFYQKRGGGMLQAFYENIPIAMFLLLPIFALLLKLFFRRKGEIAIHLVFTFYLFSFMFITFSVLLLLHLLINIPLWVEVLVTISTILYLIFGVKRFYEQTLIKSIIKAWPCL